MMRHGGILATGLAALSLLAGCTAAEIPSSTAAETTSTPGSPKAPVAVHGTEVCEIVDASYGVPIRETFHCVETTSDARLNGEWEVVVTTTDTGGGVGTWAAELVMTNDGGTWRGTATGTLTGMDTGQPMNFGEVVWAGEGGYAGLTYHELIHGSNSQLDTAGWVEPT